MLLNRKDQSGKRTWPEWPEIAGSKRFQANGSQKQQPEWLLDKMDFFGIWDDNLDPIRRTRLKKLNFHDLYQNRGILVFIWIARKPSTLNSRKSE